MSAELPPDLHSAAYFGDQRDFWWNADFVALCLQRVGLSGPLRMLDAGCGVGHWGRVLLPHLPLAHLTGVDREPRWIQEAAARAQAQGLSGQTHYQTGDVQALPFADATFDAVTCQTVLIHVLDVGLVLREFVRVLRPGGVLLIAEPNNLAGTQSVGSVRHDEPIERRLALIRLHMAIERGKIALGQGDNSVADRLPGLIAEAGLTQIRAWIADRPPMVVPPYSSADQQAFIRDFVEQFDRGWWGWSREDTQRYYLASGQNPAEFAGLWQIAREAMAQDATAMKAGQFSAAWGGLQYVFAAAKPGGAQALGER